MKWFGRNASHGQAGPLPTDNKGLGDLGEELAVSFLEGKKYRILERNFRCKGGRSGYRGPGPAGQEPGLRGGQGPPRPLLRRAPTGSNPVQAAPDIKGSPDVAGQTPATDADARFDVIAILLADGGAPTIEHIVNAFELAY